MQPISFALRQSTASSVYDHRSRYVPSSIYSGPGPAEDESPLPPHPVHSQYAISPQNDVNGTHTTTAFNHANSINGANGSRNTYESDRSSPYTQRTRPRTSVVLDTSDPVAMHLLAETAMSDSKGYEIVSFEELELLKRDRLVLRNRIDATKRRITLECTLRDAARSLSRIQPRSNGSVEIGSTTDMGHMRNLGGSKNSNNDALNRANEEYNLCQLKIDSLTQDLEEMEARLENTQRRVLEHTAGILQFTHKGLKKNLRRNELPRGPESMASPGHPADLTNGQFDDFDERSLYPVPDYVHEFAQYNPMRPVLPCGRRAGQNGQLLEGFADQLHAIGSRVHELVKQLNPTETVGSPPVLGSQQTERNGQSALEEQLNYLTSGLDALVTAQKKTLEESDNVNARIRKMMEKTESASKSALGSAAEVYGEDLASQLAFSDRTLQQLQARVETLIAQKEILTRQIQQQRELNSKSDAQRDAQIQDLSEELAEMKRAQATTERESKESQNQIALLIDQLDHAKHVALLAEEQRVMDDHKALQSERDAHKAAEQQLLVDIAAQQELNVQLQADLAKARNDVELRSQKHTRQLDALTTAKEEAQIDARKQQSEAEKLLDQVAAIQTELTIVKAELDGAYGTRAQRAADISLSPAIQREIDSLNARNAELQKELKDTIEDYEQMTKASIEFEKERDQFESSIDVLREKCESLESQLNEEKLKWLGFKSEAPTDTTSTMVLKNEFKKMMRDTRTASMKAIRAEQEERRRLEAVIRTMRKDAGLTTPAKLIGFRRSGEPSIPSAKG